MKCVILFLVISSTLFANTDLTSAKKYLREHRIEDEYKIKLDKSSEEYKSVSLISDPETKMWVYIFGLSNTKKKVLSEKQCENIKKIIEERKASTVNWHDVRNVIRVKANICLWEFILEDDEVSKAKLEKDWQEWSKLRLDYMYQENCASHQFLIKCWNIFTEDQKKSILNGNFDKFIKKNKGHARKFSADKIVRKVLGKPSRVEALAQVVESWQIEWSSFYKKFLKAMLLNRQVEVSLDKYSKPFRLSVWNNYKESFAEFLQLEKESVTEIIEVAYDLDEDNKRKIEAYLLKMKTDMLNKYRVGAEDLFVLMGYVL